MRLNNPIDHQKSHPDDLRRDGFSMMINYFFSEVLQVGHVL